MRIIFLFLSLLLGMASCTLESNGQVDASDKASVTDDSVAETQERSIIQEEGTILKDRILPPQGYERISATDDSFGHYLRQLPLKKHGSKVLHYNGSEKRNNGVYVAVVDKGIGKKDLHQCADAVMRLRADYLYDQKRFDEIHFNFTNGFRVDYSEWMKGKRIKVNGNKTHWVQNASASNSKESYWKYLEQIFMYAGTLSLDKELNKVDIAEMKIGDVFIKGGSPGHAVIVVDMVKNKDGKKKFLLAQSYMPAQEIQILRNPSNSSDDPWYSLEGIESLQTPEWGFNKDQLKRF